MSEISNIKCPRCGHSLIVDYGEYIECRVCTQEFDKKDIINFQSRGILSLQEKTKIVKILKEDKD